MKSNSSASSRRSSKKRKLDDDDSFMQDDYNSENEEDNEPVKSPILRRLRTSSRVKNTPKYTFDEDEDDEDDEKDDDTLNDIDDNDVDFENISLPPLKNKIELSSSIEDKEDKGNNEKKEQKDEIMNEDNDDSTKTKENNLSVEIIDINAEEILKNKNDLGIIDTNNNINKSRTIDITMDDEDDSLKIIDSSISEMSKAEEKESPKIEAKSRVAAMRTKRKSKIEDKKEEDKIEEEKEEVKKSVRKRSSRSSYSSKRRSRVKDIQYLELSDDE